ncbi:MAG: chemoreceptor glutamine deamidase CheD [Rhodoferax sp.]
MTHDVPLMDIFLQPGELFVADAAYQIRTILGSCVSITLWHPQARVGGMSHFLLPSREGPAPAGELDGRYADEALALMVHDLRGLGVDARACEAKIFGGGNMFPGQTRAGRITVGERNGLAARELLQRHGIKLVSESLFGNGHRQVVFNIRTGDVWVRQVRPSRLEADADRYAAKGMSS